MPPNPKFLFDGGFRKIERGGGNRDSGIQKIKNQPNIFDLNLDPKSFSITRMLPYEELQ
jgi:hypothetical protein